MVPAPVLTVVRTPGLALERPTSAGGCHVQYATNLLSPVTYRMNRVFRMNFSLYLSLNPQLSTINHYAIRPPTRETSTKPSDNPSAARPAT